MAPKRGKKLARIMDHWCFRTLIPTTGVEIDKHVFQDIQQNCDNPNIFCRTMVDMNKKPALVILMGKLEEPPRYMSHHEEDVASSVTYFFNTYVIPGNADSFTFLVQKFAYEKFQKQDILTAENHVELDPQTTKSVPSVPDDVFLCLKGDCDSLSQSIYKIAKFLGTQKIDTDTLYKLMSTMDKYGV